MAKELICPKCGSNAIDRMDNSFSYIRLNRCKCANCGFVFEVEFKHEYTQTK